MAVAYCFTNGVIHIDQACPQGALPIASGDSRKLHECLEGMATLAWDNKTLLIPGFGFAENEDEKLDAVLEFSRRVEQSLRREQ